MTTTIVILSIVIIGLILIIYNLLTKNEKLEDMVLVRNKVLTEVKNIIDQSNEKLKEIDDRGTFKSDDEIGFFFTSVLSIQETINNYFKSII